MELLQSEIIITWAPASDSPLTEWGSSSISRHGSSVPSPKLFPSRAKKVEPSPSVMQVVEVVQRVLAEHLGLGLHRLRRVRLVLHREGEREHAPDGPTEEGAHHRAHAAREHVALAEDLVAHLGEAHAGGPLRQRDVGQRRVGGSAHERVVGAEARHERDGPRDDLRPQLRALRVPGGGAVEHATEHVRLLARLERAEGERATGARSRARPAGRAPASGRSRRRG